MSACICAANSSEGTYSPGYGAPVGGGLITWYMSTGTFAVPGVPVAMPVTVECGVVPVIVAWWLVWAGRVAWPVLADAAV